MALRMLRPFRRDDQFERMRQRDLPAVYRYALAVLPGEADAREVTRATFERVRDPSRKLEVRRLPARHRLVDIAHELSRARVQDETEQAPRADEGHECAEVERLLSRALDGGVPRSDRRRLRSHLTGCEACRTREASYRAVRAALRSLATIPVPSELLETDRGEPRFTSNGRRGSLGSEELDGAKGRPMGIVNRRNAMLGWAAWQIGKRVAKRKAKSAVPAVDSESKRPNKPALAAAVAALVGGLVFWKRQRGSGESDATE
jgi:hypothetical protein